MGVWDRQGTLSLHGECSRRAHWNTDLVRFQRDGTGHRLSPMRARWRAIRSGNWPTRPHGYLWRLILGSPGRDGRIAGLGLIDAGCPRRLKDRTTSTSKRSWIFKPQSRLPLWCRHLSIPHLPGVLADADAKITASGRSGSGGFQVLAGRVPYCAVPIFAQNGGAQWLPGTRPHASGNLAAWPEPPS